MVQFSESPVPSGVGIREEQLHVASGLRNAQLHSTISTSIQGVGVAFIGNELGTMMGTWPAGLRSQGFAWNPVLAVPMTPFVSFVAIWPGGALPKTVQVRIRMVGTNQFGAYQEEITPWVSRTMTTTAQWFGVYMSKVFATVDEVYVMTDNITNVGNLSKASIGWTTIIDPTRAQAAVIADHPDDAAWEFAHGGALASTTLNFCGTEANWGIGTPVRCSPFGPSIPFPSPEIVGAMGIILREKTTPTAINQVASLPGRGQIAVAGVAPTTGVCIGRSVSGWQGDMNKFGFFSNDAWTTKIAGINFSGSSTRAGSGTPQNYTQVGEDDIQISSIIRTTIGSRRGANATRSYPNG